MQWVCEHCESQNGPEVVYCPSCGEPGPSLRPSADNATRLRTGPDTRSTLVGTSAGIAPSLLDRTSDPALAQPLPRRVRISVAGWTSLVGGWPELCVCMVAAPAVAVVSYGVLAPLLGAAGAALATTGLGLFLALALLAGAGETSRALRAYRLARTGWAAGGEVTRKIAAKQTLGAEYFVEYTFVDARGVHRRGKQEISQDQWQTVAAHEPVTILYDPQKPEQSLVYGLLGIMAIEPAAMRGALSAASGASSGGRKPSNEPSPGDTPTDDLASVGIETEPEHPFRGDDADH